MRRARGDSRQRKQMYLAYLYRNRYFETIRYGVVANIIASHGRLI